MSKHAILIVDDEPHILSSLNRTLQGEDREIFLAENAEKAWSILKEKSNMEVILCDNKLPDTLGIDFLTKVKRLYPDTVRILVTGYPDLDSAMEAINKAHIWRYILKPVEVDDLKALITQSFEYHRILKENRLLLRIARQQAEWLKIFKEKHPEVLSKEIENSALYSRDEKIISEIITEFIKKYYPETEED